MSDESNSAADTKPKGRWLAFLLVLGHFILGLIGCAGACNYHSPHLPEAVFVGLVFNQTSLLPLDESRSNEGVAKAEADNLDFETQVDCLTLVEFNDEFTKTTFVREFGL